MNKVKNIMVHDLIVVDELESIIKASDIMKQKGIRHLPVIDKNRKIVGLLSDRDVQKAISVLQKDYFTQKITIDPNFLVKDFMSWPVCIVHESTSLSKAAEEMLNQKFSALLVENNKGAIIGMITTDDLLKKFIQILKKLEGEAFKDIGDFFNEVY